MSFNNFNDFSFSLNNNIDRFNQTVLNSSNQLAPLSGSELDITSLATDIFFQPTPTEDMELDLKEYALTDGHEVHDTNEDNRIISVDFDNPSTFSSVDYDSDSMETKRNSRKRNMQSAESNIFEDRDPKKRRLDNSQMHTINDPSPDSSSSSSSNERMRFIPVSSSNSTATNVQYAAAGILKAVQNEVDPSLPLDSLGSSTPSYNPYMSDAGFSQSQSSETEFNLRKYGFTVEDEIGVYSGAPSSSSSDYMDISREPSSISSSSSSAVNQDPSSSSSSSSEMNILDRDGWCSFNPERSATRIFDQIESGTLKVAEYFPNGFKITDAEWETLKEHLPDSIKNLTYPRGLINKFIEFLLHENVSDTIIFNANFIYYKSTEGEPLSVELKYIKKNDLYETKRQICMRLARFHGFLSIRFKQGDYINATNIKNAFNKNFLCTKIKNYFPKYEHNWGHVKAKVLEGFDRKQEIELVHVKYLVMLGMGSSPKTAINNYCRRSKDPLFIEKLKDLILNTDLVSRLDAYIRENCPDLKKYWMPHLI